MSYTIKIEYQTGDSFNTEDCTDTIDGTWENLAIIEENLDRIEQHYKWYEWEHSSFLKRCYPNEKRDKPSFTCKDYDGALMLKLDDGTEYQYSAFWCGYFERLYDAEIIQVGNSKHKRSFR